VKLGIIHLWGDDLAGFRADLRLCEELGYDYIGIGDSPAGWHELYLSMAAAAEVNRTATIVPMVSSPFLRHPIITANCLCTLHDLYDGRIALGFGAGGSTVMSIGEPPATLAQLREHIGVLRDLWAGRGSRFEGKPVKPLRFPRDVPLIFSAFGPKAIALAAEVADGVALFAGSRHLDKLEQQIAHFRDTARAAGRDPSKLEIWVTSFTSVQETRAKAIHDAMAFVSASPAAFPRTREALAATPGQFRDKILKYQACYDPTEHVVPNGRNVATLHELGLAEYLADFDTTLGPPDEVGAALGRMEQLGVDAFFAPVLALLDRQHTIRALAEIRRR
jgi:alkanesulfonate monooxygenase SsuD/methylene tetrahydromethanopterin reductase-like flavin-dependent oxidoreductase (luciferase family)